MGTSARFALRYPESGDENNVPLDMAELASDVDGRLSRAFECTSVTRPTGIGSGFIIRETDTGNWLGYNGTTWVALSGAGGGGGSTGGGRHTATGAGQSIVNTSSGPGTIVAFGTASTLPVASTLLTRTTQGDGHKFELLASGMWACGATVRVASSAAAGELSAAIWADLDGGTFDADFNVVQDGGKREGLPRTLQASRTLYLPSGTRIVVYLFNGTGTTRTLEPSSGAWVNLDLWLVG